MRFLNGNKREKKTVIMKIDYWDTVLDGLNELGDKSVTEEIRKQIGQKKEAKIWDVE